MNWMIDHKGFHWTEAGPPESQPLLRFNWHNDLAGTFEPGDGLNPVVCSQVVASALKTTAVTLLRTAGNQTIETANGRLILVRDETRFGIAFLSSTQPSWKRSQLSIIDLAQLVEQLYPTRIDTIPGNRKGIVIAAPHAPSETGTATMTEKLSRSLDCGHVIAWGFRDRGDRFIPHSIGRFINVNRPTERITNTEGKNEYIITKRAQAVHEEYRLALADAGGGLPLNDLIELHGFRKRLRHNADMEIATVGWEKKQLNKLKRKLSHALHRHNVSSDVLVEPMDILSYSASDTKSSGSLQSSVATRSLHIESAMQIRKPSVMKAIVEVLAEFYNDELT